MYALPIDQSGLAGFIPTERQPNRRQRRAMYAMQPRQRRMPRRIQLPRGVMGGGLIPVIGRQTNGQIISQELGEDTSIPEVAIEDYDIESSIPQTVIGEAAFGAGMFPELADQQGNLYAQQSSPLAEQEGQWGASWPSWSSGFTFETPYTGKVGPFLTGSGVTSAVVRGSLPQLIGKGAAQHVAPLVTPAVKAAMGEKVTGKDWTFAGLGLLASLFFPAFMPILGLISFITDLMDPPKTEPESVLQEGVDIPGLAGPKELARSGLGLGITPDVFYDAYAEPGNPYTVIDTNIDFGQLPSGWEADLAQSIAAQEEGTFNPYSQSFVPTSEDMFGVVQPEDFNLVRDRGDVMYGGLTHTGGFADAQGLSSMVPQSVPQSYSTSLPDHLYGDQAKDFFDLTEDEVTQMFETGFASYEDVPKGTFAWHGGGSYIDEPGDFYPDFTADFTAEAETSGEGGYGIDPD